MDLVFLRLAFPISQAVQSGGMQVREEMFFTMMQAILSHRWSLLIDLLNWRLGEKEMV
jgi:hypothetical protein